ncbi:MAG: hypothetical protein SGJ27_11670 [Candidatus Melainabacteria bacterium]|nr:hypothetical protein [Candidatus Melainabacteria bacterium]
MAIDTYIGNWTDEDLRRRLDDLPNYRSLVLYGPGVTDAGAELISKCTNLRELHLVDTQITDDGIKQIAKLQNLDWLVIDNAAISDRGMNELHTLKSLTGLHMVATKSKEDGLAVLMQLPHLCYLEVVGQDIRNVGTSIISQLPSLHSLRLASTTADDRDFLNLAYSTSLQQLAYDMPLVSKEAVAELNQRLSGLALQTFHFYKPEERISYLSGYCLDLYERREYDQAKSAANDVLRWFPFNPAAHGARAFINFELGNIVDFRKDMENFRDNANLFGDHDLYQMAKYYLTLESAKAVRLMIDHEKPQALLVEKLRATTLKKQKEEPVASLIRRIEQVARGAGDQLIGVPTLAQIAAASHQQNQPPQQWARRKHRDTESTINLPWSW